MTYSEYIQHHAETPKELVSCIEIRQDSRLKWYRAHGIWQGQKITACAPDFPKLQAMIRDRYRLCIPARKAFIFSHAANGVRFALLQGHIPGNPIVDMSDYNPPRKIRS